MWSSFYGGLGLKQTDRARCVMVPIKFVFGFGSQPVKLSSKSRFAIFGREEF